MCCPVRNSAFGIESMAGLLAGLLTSVLRCGPESRSGSKARNTREYGVISMVRRIYLRRRPCLCNRTGLWNVEAQGGTSEAGLRETGS